MSRIASVPQVVTARLDEVPPTAIESTQVQLVRSGSLILRHGRSQTRFMPGDVAVYDVSQPFEFIYPEEFATVIVQLPTAELVPPGRNRRNGTARGSVPAVLATLLRSADEHYDSLSENSRAALARGVLDAARLFAAGVGQQHDRSASGVADRARRYAAQHSTDVALSSSSIAAHLHVSLRTLHSAFEDERETLGQFIRAERMEHARHLLLTTGESVATVAQRVGYLDATSFIRAFKGAEGITPSRWRHRQLRESFESARP